MTFTRIAVAAGIVVLTAFLVVVVLAGPAGLGSVVGAALAIVVLIAGGNLLYGRRSHYAAAQARTRPAREAHYRAIDEARRLEREEAVRDAGTSTGPSTVPGTAEPPPA